jgi:hypothetical protein
MTQHEIRWDIATGEFNDMIVDGICVPPSEGELLKRAVTNVYGSVNVTLIVRSVPRLVLPMSQPRK